MPTNGALPSWQTTGNVYRTHLHVPDEVARPQGFEDKVRKAQNGQILNQLFSEVMVDAEDLLLREILFQVAVQLPVALQVLAEGLLDDHPRPAAPAPTHITVIVSALPYPYPTIASVVVSNVAAVCCVSTCPHGCCEPHL